MKNNIVDKPVSLWEVLKSDNVIIPIFQRDYAQGRKGKEELRKKFLTELKTALEAGQDLHLDFVYGTRGEDAVYPLDGQQRMTTLWLLMWYAVFVDYKNNIYEKDERLQLLGKFAYQTRPSSQNFVSWLCSEEFFVTLNSYKENVTKEGKKNLLLEETFNISEFIQGQNRFLAKWKQDPTIQAMLRMLSGTYANKGEGNQDGIAQIFKDSDILKYKLFDACPIKFYNLNLQGIKDANNLYIKMNARGEQLTDFENFKADLIGYFSKDEELKCFVDSPDTDAYILSKWDCEWTDIFWKYRNDHDTVDTLFFAFIKRFLLNRITAGVDRYEYEVSYEEYEKFLIDETSEYTTFDTYKPILTADSIEDLKKILNCLHDNKELQNILSDRYVYPKYSEKEGLANFTRQDRVVMHGICRYLTLTEGYDSEHFRHWLHVLKNLALYNEIPDPARFKERISLVENVLKVLTDNRNFDIYEFDKEDAFRDFIDRENENNTQLKEEIKKIGLIKENSSYEENIKNIESNWVFEGRINCLLEPELFTHPELPKVLNEYLGDQGKNKISECQGKVVELFQAIMSKYDKEDQTELIIYNEHNNLRKLLNGPLKEAFVAVVKELLEKKSIEDIISDSNIADLDWRFPLIKYRWLWNYSNKCKIKKVNEKWYLFKGSYKNDADISLDESDEKYYERFKS